MHKECEKFRRRAKKDCRRNKKIGSQNRGGPNPTLHLIAAVGPEESSGLRLSQQQVHHPAAADVCAARAAVGEEIVVVPTSYSPCLD
jgi:hypothetical protein